MAHPARTNRETTVAYSQDHLIQPGAEDSPHQEPARTMPNPTGRLTRLLTPLLLLAACGSDHGLHRTTKLLNDRLQEQLAPDIGAGAASLQPLPNGARVTLL